MRKIASSIIGWSAFGFIIFGCCGIFSSCIELEKQSIADRAAVKAARKSDAIAATTNAVGKKIASITFGSNCRSVTFHFDDGSTITVWSVSHHSAGSHCEIGSGNINKKINTK